jgi:hypothetical protein
MRVRHGPGRNSAVLSRQGPQVYDPCAVDWHYRAVSLRPAPSQREHTGGRSPWRRKPCHRRTGSLRAPLGSPTNHPRAEHLAATTASTCRAHAIVRPQAASSPAWGKGQIVAGPDVRSTCPTRWASCDRLPCARQDGRAASFSCAPHATHRSQATPAGTCPPAGPDPYRPGSTPIALH